MNGVFFRVFLTAMLATCVWSPTAEASPKQEAIEYARKGNVAYNLGNYDEAAEQYEQAYRLVQDPNILFNIAQSYRLSNHPDKALASFKGFLRTAPPKHKNRMVAEEHVLQLTATVNGGAVQSKDGEPPPGVPTAKPKPDDEFSPYGSTVEVEADNKGGDSDGVNTIRALAPTIGATLGLANQEGLTGGERLRFSLFTRVNHDGNTYEAGYFITPLFAPNPHYTTSALYFRYRSKDNWYGQVGALGKNGDFHGGGGMDWQYLTVGALIQRVGHPHFCTSGQAVTYLAPELKIAIPVAEGLKARAVGGLQYALAQGDSCGFHPSMSTLIVEADWAFSQELTVRGGLGFYQFFGADTASAGPWPPGETNSSIGAVHAGGRYTIDTGLAAFGSFRYMQYAGGIHELIAGFEFTLGTI
ncbi:MAG: tetratricopeptide repeat protein [Deltaproteobacteria bacterium]|nr:tetratricopeptide repeat protein [Deltaproteobacteria bacterium]